MQTDANGMPVLEPLVDPASTATFNTAFGLIAGGVDQMRPIRSFKWANAAARNAQTGMTEGDIGDQADTNEVWRYSGSAWGVVYGPVAQTNLSSSLGSGFSGVLVYRESGNMVQLIGNAITRNVAWTTNTTVGTVPAGYRPPAGTSNFLPSPVFNSSTGGAVGVATLTTAGVLQVWGQTAAAGNGLHFSFTWIK